MDRTKLALCGVLGASLALNALQATRLLRLADSASEQPLLGELHPGTVVPSIELKDLTGRRVIVDYRIPTSTVLYVFRPSCTWCALNSKSLASLTEQVSKRYRIIGLSLSADGLEDFVRSHSIAFPVYRDLSPDAITTYRLDSTPETIVVAPNGIVSASWKGAFAGTTRQLIERFFSIRLPEPQL